MQGPVKEIQVLPHSFSFTPTQLSPSWINNLEKEHLNRQ